MVGGGVCQLGGQGGVHRATAGPGLGKASRPHPREPWGRSRAAEPVARSLWLHRQVLLGQAGPTGRSPGCRLCPECVRRATPHLPPAPGLAAHKLS